MSNKIYESVTNRIIQKIESGNLQEWLRSWNAGDLLNPESGTRYKGINYILLKLAGYKNPNWLTFKQISAKGGRVKKGEKSTQIIYFKQLNVEDKNKEGETIEKKIPMLRGYLVFNAEQCEGLPEELYTIPEPKEKKFSNLLNVATNSGFKISLGGNRACYSPLSDSISMPDVESFNTSEGFEAVLLHELTHLTGHETRLNRLNKLARFGSSAYAFEELIAELGSAFACAKLGIKGELQHAEYINSWLQVLKKDTKVIFKAAAEAQKACDFLLENLQEKQSLLLAA